MKPILVLGLGNRLMMDDGVGVAVVEALAGQNPLDERLSYAVGETDFEYGLSMVMPAEYLIVIDAAITGKNPGDLSIFPLGEVASAKPGLSQHQVHFLDLLLQLDPQKKGVLIGIEPFQVDFHWGLSTTLQKEFGHIVNTVKAAIEVLKCDLP